MAVIFKLVRTLELLSSIILLGLSGFIAGWGSFSAGVESSSIIAGYLWPAWLALVAGLIVMITAICALATRGRSSRSVVRSSWLLVTDILIFILMLVCVIGFANRFKYILQNSISALTRGYSSDYSYYGYSYYYDVPAIDIAWYNSIKADMGILAVLLIVSFALIFISAVGVHKARGGSIPTSQTFSAQGHTAFPSAYPAAMGPPPPQPVYTGAPQPYPAAPVQQVQVYPDKLQ
ncbi:hypothetical protein H072_4993 [Dactylellina haptotyla CBS 200.50]|uniref:MARVEL domain-containing protein n=1 Tax=Dactylellina haptotyla (strain CBS 200.50) TaxID=1284197 RepID=S8ADW3_DACHA|nr:hypothetical protein H072_4993 [Dactylellina haptotyla CBS 200.50]